MRQLSLIQIGAGCVVVVFMTDKAQSAAGPARERPANSGDEATTRLLTGYSTPQPVARPRIPGDNLHGGPR
jgi:hypothetical protein